MTDNLNYILDLYPTGLPKDLLKNGIAADSKETKIKKENIKKTDIKKASIKEEIKVKDREIKTVKTDQIKQEKPTETKTFCIYVDQEINLFKKSEEYDFLLKIITLGLKLKIEEIELKFLKEYGKSFKKQIIFTDSKFEDFIDNSVFVNNKENEILLKTKSLKTLMKYKNEKILFWNLLKTIK